MTRLPGHRYTGPDPDGFMDRAAVVALLEAYARAGTPRSSAHPRRARLAAGPAGYRIDTDRGAWTARAVVIATGACDRPPLPDWAARDHRRGGPARQRLCRPRGALPGGGVLVVGASASGAQIARELARRRPRRHAGGRPPHPHAAPLPRPRHHALARPGRASSTRRGTRCRSRRGAPAPSLQLTGRGGDIGLRELADAGVRLVGRVTGATGPGSRSRRPCRRRRRPPRRGSPGSSSASTAYRRHRSDAGAPRPPPPFIPGAGPAALDLRAEGIGTVILATGYRRDYRWLDLPVLDAAGELRHDGGITAVPGLYALGLRFLRRRSSSFLDGVGRDAEALAPIVAAHLGATRRAA
jgi:putative flavoprotein involved in K+ transport